MDRATTIYAAVEFICETAILDREHPDMFERRVIVAADSVWVEGMTVDDLVLAVRLKMAAPR